MNEREKPLVIVRGAGDISTGTIHRLFRAGFDLLVLESERPSAIRRKVAFSEAVYDGRATVEGVWAVRIGSAEEAARCRADGYIPLIVDPEGESIAFLKPAVVVDAILAKRNLGTRMDMAPLTIGLGPGFEAGRDVHYVIETMRGHDLGRIISEGSAAPNTGIPGMVGGYGLERVIRAPGAGIFRDGKDIGSFVKAGEVIGRIEVPGSGARKRGGSGRNDWRRNARKRDGSGQNDWRRNARKYGWNGRSENCTYRGFERHHPGWLPCDGRIQAGGRRSPEGRAEKLLHDLGQGPVHSRQRIGTGVRLPVRHR